MKQFKKETSPAVLLLLLFVSTATDGFIFNQRRETPRGASLRRSAPTDQDRNLDRLLLLNRNTRTTEKDSILDNLFDRRSFRTGPLERTDENNNNLDRQRGSENVRREVRQAEGNQRNTRQVENPVRNIDSRKEVTRNLERYRLDTREDFRTTENREVSRSDSARHRFTGDSAIRRDLRQSDKNHRQIRGTEDPIETKSEERYRFDARSIDELSRRNLAAQRNIDRLTVRSERRDTRTSADTREDSTVRTDENNNYLSRQRRFVDQTRRTYLSNARQTRDMRNLGDFSAARRENEFSRRESVRERKTPDSDMPRELSVRRYVNLERRERNRDRSDARYTRENSRQEREVKEGRTLNLKSSADESGIKSRENRAERTLEDHARSRRELSTRISNNIRQRSARRHRETARREDRIYSYRNQMGEDRSSNSPSQCNRDTVRTDAHARNTRGTERLIRRSLESKEPFTCEPNADTIITNGDNSRQSGTTWRRETRKADQESVSMDRHQRNSLHRQIRQAKTDGEDRRSERSNILEDYHRAGKNGGWLMTRESTSSRTFGGEAKMFSYVDDAAGGFNVWANTIRILLGAYLVGQMFAGSRKDKMRFSPIGYLKQKVQ